MSRLLKNGLGNVVNSSRIVSIVSPESAPVKRLITEARNNNKLIDATYGRKTRAVIICDSDHVVLSPVEHDNVAHRMIPSEDTEVIE